MIKERSPNKLLVLTPLFHRHQKELEVISLSISLYLSLSLSLERTKRNLPRRRFRSIFLFTRLDNFRDVYGAKTLEIPALYELDADISRQ